MKFKNMTIIAASIVLGMGGQVQAAESGELLVKGTLTAGGCHLDLPVGVMDYGDIGVNQLGSQANNLTPKDFAIIISCDVPTKFGVTATDNRADSIADIGSGNTDVNFGLGFSQSGQKNGYYTVKVAPNGHAGIPIVTAAGNQTGAMLYSGNGVTEFNPLQNEAIAITKSGVTSISINDNYYPGSIKNTTLNFRVHPVLKHGPSLGVGSQLDGSATLSLTYL